LPTGKTGKGFFPIMVFRCWKLGLWVDAGGAKEGNFTSLLIEETFEKGFISDL
jgi:hypothetical protein